MAAINRSLGFVLLAIWLILTGLTTLAGFHFAYQGVIYGVLALAAGVLILLGR
jgi:hypothetical protein